MNSADSASALDNNANNCRKRLNRWDIRGFSWQISALPRVRKCGRVTVSNDGSVEARRFEDKVGYAGLSTCSSVWACAVCNTKIQNVRRVELGLAMAKTPGSIVLRTLTVAHSKANNLSDLLQILPKMWAKLNRDRTVLGLRKKFGFIGYSRTLEITYSEKHGWHPHFHLLYYFDKQVYFRDLLKLHDAEFHAWKLGAKLYGLSAPAESAQDFRTADGIDSALSDYLAKSSFDSLAFEMTSTQTKSAMAGATSWELLANSRRTADMEFISKFNEFEKATKGKRSLSWSRGLKKNFGIGEASDEEIAEDILGSEEDGVFKILDWEPIRKLPVLGGQILNILQFQGVQPAIDFCMDQGISVQRI